MAVKHVLFGSEASDAVKAEGEDEPVFVANSDVEGIELNRKSTAIVGIAKRV